MLAKEGIRVWGTSRSPSVHATAGGGGEPFPYSLVALDLADASSAVAAFERASAEAGGFDLVVNNAGYGVFGEFDGVPASVWRAQVDAMLGTVLCLSHSAYGSMRARGRGCLVNVASLATEFPLPYMAGYNVVKAGLSALSESLIFESRGTGITVIDFRPGDTRTTFNQAMQTHSHGERGARADRAWLGLEANLRSAPPPECAAQDLRRALLRGGSGVVRSGSFFQTRVAPLGARILPASVMRSITARYFGAA